MSMGLLAGLISVIPLPKSLRVPLTVRQIVWSDIPDRFDAPVASDSTVIVYLRTVLPGGLAAMVGRTNRQVHSDTRTNVSQFNEMKNFIKSLFYYLTLFL
jgi:hypothetical protein